MRLEIQIQNIETLKRLYCWGRFGVKAIDVWL